MKIVSMKVYFGVWCALLAGFLLNVGQSMLDLGPFNVVLALGIALCQVLLLMLFFMHLRYTSALTWLFAATGFYWLGVMFVLGLNDYLTRGWGY